MTKSTLDLLDSARDANSAQLEAALATARRRSAEEMLRMKYRQEQERIFHELHTNFEVASFDEEIIFVLRPKRSALCTATRAP